MRNRNARLAIDVVFLVLAGIFLIQDFDSGDRWGLLFWGVAGVIWVALLVSDLRRPVDADGNVEPLRRSSV